MLVPSETIPRYGKKWCKWVDKHKLNIQIHMIYLPTFSNNQFLTLLNPSII